MSDIKKRLFEWSNIMLIGSGRAKAFEIKRLRQEASTREYFRLNSKDGSHIGVFSPPSTELNKQFIFLSDFFKKEGVTVPEVLFSDTKKGLMLIEDFGDNSYQFSLNQKNHHHLFSAAIDEMICIHQCPTHPNLPSLSETKMASQMHLFEEWFLVGLLGLKVGQVEKQMISNLYQEVLNDLVQQPQVLCHFDFETRNLMVLENGHTGVLDFQDATFGPIFLDPVSLFKDLYFDISDEEINNMLKEYISRSAELNLMEKLDIQDVRKSFDLTGLQRQLRILGTLSRLHLRDGKAFRLPDLIKTLYFVIETSSKYFELKDFSEYSKKKVAPALSLTLKGIL